MVSTSLTPEPLQRPFKPIIYSSVLLAVAYGLLGLSLTESPTMSALHQRCVLMDNHLSRIWSVANIEVGLAYFGVFGAMVYYVLTTKEARDQHLRDLSMAVAYVIISFVIDLLCVNKFTPFVALLIGDAIVMTFTVIVSRRMWFQRLLGVFVPLIFLTCAVGHLLEGLSFWQRTFPMNVPWSMVTADIGFAVLVNSARFPAFIKGQDIAQELAEVQVEQTEKASFFRNVLYAVTDGKLSYFNTVSEMNTALPVMGEPLLLNQEYLSEGRRRIEQLARSKDFADERIDALTTAAGEAMMNAIVHAHEATVTLAASDEKIQVWITDHGKGISLADLPSAALLKGWSSRGTLGMGFSMMLSLADSIDLCTGANGTTLCLTVGRAEPPITAFGL